MADGTTSGPDLSLGPDPAYEQVRRFIADQIDRGELAPGSRLMSERTLAEHLGVSRVTIRRSLQELVATGLVTASRGRGWYVTPKRLGEPPNALLSFTDMVRAGGGVPRTELLTREEIGADERLAAALGAAPAARLLLLERLRYADTFPFAVTTSWLAASRFAALTDMTLPNGSLYEALKETFDVVPTRADFVVEARGASARIAELLGLAVGAPVLSVTQTTHDQHGEVFEFGITVYPADHYQFRATVATNPTTPSQRSASTVTAIPTSPRVHP
jgi:GntR family transcriptional regulator